MSHDTFVHAVGFVLYLLIVLRLLYWLAMAGNNRGGDG